MLINSTHIPDIVSAIRELIGDQKALIAIAEKTTVDINSLVRALDAAGIEFMGGMFPMLIFDAKVIERGIVVNTLYNVEHIGTIQHISKKDIHIPHISFEENQPYTLVTFVDGLTTEIPHFLGKLYEHYGMETNYIGGGAGSLTLQQMPCVFSNEGFFEDTAIYAIVKLKSNIGVKHGWKKLEGPYIVTKSKGNIIQEINWEKPFKVYKEIVESKSDERFNQDNFFEIAKGYPLGIIKQELDYVVRDPIAFNENDELLCVCNVEENSLINILKGEPDNLLIAAKEASEESLIHAVNPQLAIVIDCISRVLYLGDTFENELQNITQTIHNKYPGIPVNGALTLGEISSYGNGYIEFYNKTIVVGLFE